MGDWLDWAEQNAHSKAMSDMYDAEEEYGWGEESDFTERRIKKMEVTVEARSDKFGPSFLANGTWYKQDKYAKPDFSGAQKGAVLEIEANGAYVKSLTVKSEGAPSGPKPAQSSGGFKPRTEDPTVRTEIARSTAVKAAFESPSLAEATKNMDLSQTISELKAVAKELTNYILTGEFSQKA